MSDLFFSFTTYGGGGGKAFSGGSEYKETVCNARDLSLIPGLGKSPWDSYPV